MQHYRVAYWPWRAVNTIYLNISDTQVSFWLMGRQIKPFFPLRERRQFCSVGQRLYVVLDFSMCHKETQFSIVPCKNFEQTQVNRPSILMLLFVNYFLVLITQRKMVLVLNLMAKYGRKKRACALPLPVFPPGALVYSYSQTCKLVQLATWNLRDVRLWVWNCVQLCDRLVTCPRLT